MTTFTLAAPTPYFGIQAQSGTQYAADKSGVITGIAANDLASLLDAGCYVPKWIGRILGADMNVATDQPFVMLIGNPYTITKITAVGVTGQVSLTTAVGGIYPAASKAGTAIVANSQAYSGISTALLTVDLTIVSGQSGVLRAAGFVPIFALTTIQGAASTADLYLFADVY